MIIHSEHNFGVAYLDLYIDSSIVLHVCVCVDFPLNSQARPIWLRGVLSFRL